MQKAYREANTSMMNLEIYVSLPKDLTFSKISEHLPITLNINKKLKRFDIDTYR